jgi:hypothetical protein
MPGLIGEQAGPGHELDGVGCGTEPQFICLQAIIDDLLLGPEGVRIAVRATSLLSAAELIEAHETTAMRELE